MSSRIEENFRLAVVTQVHEDWAQTVTLYSEWRDDQVPTPAEKHVLRGEGYINREAIVSDLQVWAEVIEFLEHDLSHEVWLPEEGVSTYGGPYHVLTPQNFPYWHELAAGRILHIHDLRREGEAGQEYSTQYCFDPRLLSLQGIVASLESANTSRRQRLHDEIIELETKEGKLPELYRVIDPEEPFRLLEDIGWITDDTGSKYLHVPPRVLVSNRYGIQLLQVQVVPIDITADRWLAGRAEFLINGYELWRPNNYPLEETDSRGELINPGRPHAEVVITISNPYRSLGAAAGLEEQKIVMELGGQRWTSQVNLDVLSTNFGVGGVSYTDFLGLGDPAVYHEYRSLETNDAPFAGRSQQPLPSRLVVPTDDLDQLQELEIRLPGFI